jgi:hypothetical protein
MADTHDLHSPPPTPWEKGAQKGYTAFSLTVDVCEDEFGRVWSGHSFESDTDEETALQLKNGGAPQVAYALLTEAMRREVFVLMLMRMSQDPEFLQQWRDADEEVKRGLEAELGFAARQVMTDTLSKMVAGVGREILTMLSEIE